MKHHDLKCWPEAFERVIAGEKCHEVRRCNDREFRPGDTVTLHEFTMGAGYTGRTSGWVIGHVTAPGEWGMPPDLCVFSLLTSSRPLQGRE